MSFDLKLTDGDITFNEFGQLEIVEDAEKLAQQASKIVYEAQGDNLEDFQYGTILRSLVGQSGDGEVLKTMAFKSIDDALARLQSYQTQQELNGQHLSPKEKLVQYANFNITTSTTDPRNMYITGELFYDGGSTTLSVEV